MKAQQSLFMRCPDKWQAQVCGEAGHLLVVTPSVWGSNPRYSWEPVYGLWSNSRRAETFCSICGAGLGKQGNVTTWNSPDLWLPRSALEWRTCQNVTMRSIFRLQIRCRYSLCDAVNISRLKQKHWKFKTSDLLSNSTNTCAGNIGTMIR